LLKISEKSSRLKFKRSDNSTESEVVDPLHEYKCNECAKSYKHSPSLKRHIRDVHSGTQAWPCQFCDRVWRTKSRLQGHLSHNRECKGKRDKYKEEHSLKYFPLAPITELPLNTDYSSFYGDSPDMPEVTSTHHNRVPPAPAFLSSQNPQHNLVSSREGLPKSSFHPDQQHFSSAHGHIQDCSYDDDKVQFTEENCTFANVSPMETSSQAPPAADNLKRRIMVLTTKPKSEVILPKSRTLKSIIGNIKVFADQITTHQPIPHILPIDESKSNRGCLETKPFVSLKVTEKVPGQNETLKNIRIISPIVSTSAHYVFNKSSLTVKLLKPMKPRIAD